MDKYENNENTFLIMFSGVLSGKMGGYVSKCIHGTFQNNCKNNPETRE